MTALELLARTIINPAHPTDIIPVAQDGQIIGQMATCTCGFDAIRPSEEEAQIEAALHRRSPNEWLASIDQAMPRRLCTPLAAA